jgi:hypothetical protein
MPTKRIVKASDIVKDIRSGLTDGELMDKYRFTHTGLQSVLTQLLDLKAMSRSELYGRVPSEPEVLDEEEIRVQNLRRAPRHLALFPIPIYDGKNPKISGTLKDVTEHGVGISGIETTVGETRTFVILGDEFVAVEFETFAFDSVCRWINTGDDEDAYSAGFEITSISERDREQLGKLLQSLTFFAPKNW